MVGEVGDGEGYSEAICANVWVLAVCWLSKRQYSTPPTPQLPQNFPSNRSRHPTKHTQNTPHRVCPNHNKHFFHRDHRLAMPFFVPAVAFFAEKKAAAVGS